MKSITYLQEPQFTFCSEAECVLQGENSHFVLTKANSVVCKFGQGEKRVLALDKVFDLNKKESFKSMALLDKNSLLVVSNRLRLFAFTINEQDGRAENARELPFKLAQNLKNATNIRLSALPVGLVLSAGRFLFVFSAKDEQFKILKLFNEDVAEVSANPMRPETVFVLTQNTLHILAIKIEQNGIAARVELRENITGLSQMAPVGGILAFRSEDSRIHLFDPVLQCWSDKIDACNAQNEFIEFDGIAALKNKVLLAYNKFYLFVFSENFSVIKYILNIKSYDYIVAEDFLIDFRRKNENIKRIATLQHEAYSKETRNLKFSRKTPEEQLFIGFSYLTKKFMKLKEISNHRVAMQELLNSLYLKAPAYTHKKFKELVLCFFTFMKDFSVQKPRTSIEKYIPNRLRIVSLRQLEETINQGTLETKRRDSTIEHQMV